MSIIDMFKSESRKQRGGLWRVIKPTKHGHRHRSAQMKFFSNAKPVRRGSFLSWK